MFEVTSSVQGIAYPTLKEIDGLSRDFAPPYHPLPHAAEPTLREVTRLPRREKSRLKTLRQDRVIAPADVLAIQIDNGNALHPVVDYSRSGVAYLIEANAPQTSFTKTTEIAIYFENKKIQTLAAEWVRAEIQSDGARKIAYTFPRQFLRIDLIETALRTREVAQRTQKSFESLCEIPPLFLGFTYSLKALLEQVREQLNLVDSEMRSQTELTTLLETQNFFAKNLAEKLKPQFEGYLNKMSEILANETKATIQKSYEFFRETLGNLIYESPFSDRSLKKPLGYAGDFQLMNMLYREEALGKDLFAKFIHYYIINMPGGQAVRNRGDYLLANLSRTLEQTHFNCRILSVASGPAMELRNTLKKYADKDLSKVTLCLLDQDQSSLKFAQNKILELVREMARPPQIEFLNCDVKSLFRRGIDATDFDLIFSAGLFDYFSNPVARVAGARLFDLLVPGGTLIIGNFDTNSPSRFFMEMAWDWHLIHRSEADLIGLFGELPGTLVVEKEAAEVNLFCKITKQNTPR